MKVYFSIKNFDGRGSLYAWIYRMAVDEAFLFLRNKRADTILDRAGRDTDLVTICSRRDFINKLMDLIPEEDRCLLFIRDFEAILSPIWAINYLTHLGYSGIIGSWKRLSHLKTRVC